MFSITFATTMQSTFGDYVCLCPRHADGSALTDWFDPTASCANCQADLDRHEEAYEAYRQEQFEARMIADAADGCRTCGTDDTGGFAHHLDPAGARCDDCWDALDLVNDLPF